VPPDGVFNFVFPKFGKTWMSGKNSMFLICKIDLSTLVRLKFKRNSIIQVFVEKIFNRKGHYRQE
jgi:hypothetical protein